jgi:hypothetical protein
MRKAVRKKVNTVRLKEYVVVLGAPTGVIRTTAKGFNKREIMSSFRRKEYLKSQITITRRTG